MMPQRQLQLERKRTKRDKKCRLNGQGPCHSDDIGPVTCTDKALESIAHTNNSIISIRSVTNAKPTKHLNHHNGFITVYGARLRMSHIAILCVFETRRMHNRNKTRREPGTPTPGSLLKGGEEEIPARYPDAF